MAYYPNGSFVREFARRTLANLQAIEADRPLEWNDSALVSFLLAVFVVPQERSEPDVFMATTLKGYSGNLDEIVEIVRDQKQHNCEPDFPKSLDGLPRYLRNAVAHFNVRPLSADEQTLTHLLVWNRIPNNRAKDAGQINFVAKINIVKLRELAKHILEQMAQKGVADRFEAIDPIAEYDRYWSASQHRAQS